MLLLPVCLNAADNAWDAAEMGQSIVYRMREDVFGPYSQPFPEFFTTPVGKLVTRVSKRYGSCPELFLSSIPVKLFKNVENHRLCCSHKFPHQCRHAWYPFFCCRWLLFEFFRSLSRNLSADPKQIMELNTFLSEHLPA